MEPGALEGAFGEEAEGEGRKLQAEGAESSKAQREFAAPWGLENNGEKAGAWDGVVRRESPGEFSREVRSLPVFRAQGKRIHGGPQITCLNV